MTQTAKNNTRQLRALDRLVKPNPKDRQARLYLISYYTGRLGETL